MNIKKMLRTLGISEDNPQVKEIMEKELETLNNATDKELLVVAKNKRKDLVALIEGAGFVKGAILKKVLKSLDKEIASMEEKISIN